MEPISLILGLVSLGSAAVSFFKQNDETNQARVAAEAEVQKAQKDLLIDRLNLNAQYIADKDQAEADVLAAKAKAAKAAQLRAQLEKNIFAFVALLALSGALFISLRNKPLFQ